MYKELFSHLVNLNQFSNVIESAALVSIDGLVMASTLPHDEDHIGAIGAAMLVLGNHGIDKLVGGELEQLLVKGALGYMLITLISEEILLIALAKPDAKLEQLFLEKQHYAKTISLLV
ncbi:MAG: roadblock/LC7 domain-containing protein [Methylococcaceae bacterium]